MSFFKPAPKPTLAPPLRSPPARPTKGGPLIDRRPKPAEAEGPPERDEALPDQVPVGRMIVLKGGFFDSRGFWCTRKADGWQVHRGAPRAVLAQMDDDQRRVLQAAQLKARRKGLR